MSAILSVSRTFPFQFVEQLFYQRLRILTARKAIRRALEQLEAQRAAQGVATAGVLEVRDSAVAFGRFPADHTHFADCAFVAHVIACGSGLGPGSGAGGGGRPRERQM